MAVAGLAATVLLAATGATAAGPRAEKLKLGADAGTPEGIIAYGKSQLLLLGDYDEETITRVDEDGSLDRSFGDRGHVDISFSGVTVTPDGKILVASSGHAANRPNDSDGQITRLLPNGARDPSFGGDGTVLIDFGGRYDGAQSTTVTADGSILVGGDKTTLVVSRGGSDAAPAFARLSPNGALDRTYGDNGVRIVRSDGETGVYDISTTPDGGVVGIGEGYIHTQLWKLTPDGSVDRSFGRRGTVELPSNGKHGVGGGHGEALMLTELTVLPSGKILVAGTDFPGRGSRYYRAVAIRLRPDGTRDRGFGRDGWAAAPISGSTFVQGMTMLPGGVLLLAADSQNRRNKRSDVGAIAFGRDGRPDPRFGHDGRLRVNLSGWDLMGEEEVVTTLGGRAVILGSQGKGKGYWLVTCPPLVGR